MPDDQEQYEEPGQIHPYEPGLTDPGDMEDEDVTEPTDYKGPIPPPDPPVLKEPGLFMEAGRTPEVEAVTNAVGTVLAIQPVAEKVTVGLQSIAGYLATASAAVGAVLGLTDVIAMPDYVVATLSIIAAVLTALTNHNRTSQRNANTKAAAQVASAALAPVNVQDLATGQTVPAHVVIETRPPS